VNSWASAEWKLLGSSVIDLAEGGLSCGLRNVEMCFGRDHGETSNPQCLTRPRTRGIILTIIRDFEPRCCVAR